MRRVFSSSPVGYFALSLPGIFLLIGFFLFPLLVVLLTSFMEGGGDAFTRLFQDSLFFRGLWGSLVLSFSASAVSLLSGFLIALRMVKLSARIRNFLMLLISLPLTFSGMVVAYGFILTFGRAGFFTLILARIGVDPAAFSRFIYSPIGLSFAYCYYLIPRVVFNLLPVLLNFDTRKLLAAESFGAGKIRQVFEILLPEILPAIASAFCLVFSVSFGAYGTALALTGTQLNILPLLLYSKISDVGSDFPLAAALSVILLSVGTLVMSFGEIFASWRKEAQG
ncbi:MAG: ABC transporter permease subunit [Spirochaetales bacterium]